MSTAPNPPGQTIVLERRERPSWLRRLFWPVLIISLLFNANQLAQKEGLAPSKLDEEYLAGSINPTDPKIAVVRIEGVIALDTVDFAVKQVKQAREDDSVEAVVLRVDSPGGTVTGADQIWREVELLKRTKKPIVVSMGGLAASGGYYVAAPAERIIAEPTTTTGSIGVILELPNASELMEKIGVDFHAVTAGEWKNMGSPFAPLSDRDVARFQEMVDATYQRFLKVVAQGRGLTMGRARELAEGKIYTADEALALGLVDRLGYLEDAIVAAKGLASIDSARVVRYKEPLSFPAALFGIKAPDPGLTLDEKSLLELRTPRMLMILR